jgi:hypothetical protein
MPVCEEQNLWEEPVQADSLDLCRECLDKPPQASETQYISYCLIDVLQFDTYIWYLELQALKSTIASRRAVVRPWNAGL